jgi:hypothetical protein
MNNRLTARRERAMHRFSVMPVGKWLVARGHIREAEVESLGAILLAAKFEADYARYCDRKRTESTALAWSTHSTRRELTETERRVRRQFETKEPNT